MAAYAETFKRYGQAFNNAKSIDEWKKLSAEFTTEIGKMEKDDPKAFNRAYPQYAAVVRDKFAALSRITGDESLSIKI